MANVELGISDDYAILSDDHHQYYYGYEETANDGEWCFTVKQIRTKHEICRFTTSHLLANSEDLKRFSQDEPYIYLLVGMALFKEGEI